MPNRIIKEGICTSKNIAALSCGAERLFYRLIVQADDYGLFFANSMIVKSKCFPLIADDIKSAQVQAWLEELDKAQLIFFYQADETMYLKFTKWEKHQQRRADKPKYPLPVPVSEVLQADDINGKQAISDDINGKQMHPREDRREKIKENENGEKVSKIPPTLADVEKFCTDEKYKMVASKWYDYYLSNGWIVGKTKMKDWKAAVRNWERRETGHLPEPTPEPIKYKYIDIPYVEPPQEPIDDEELPF